MHIDVKHHLLNHHTKEGNIDIMHTPGTENPIMPSIKPFHNQYSPNICYTNSHRHPPHSHIQSLNPPTNTKHPAYQLPNICMHITHTPPLRQLSRSPGSLMLSHTHHDMELRLLSADMVLTCIRGNTLGLAAAVHTDADF